MKKMKPYFYEEKYCSIAKSVLERGGSLTKVCAVIGISKEGLANWRRSVPEFEDAIQEGLAASEAHWEDIAYDNLISSEGRTLNTALYQLQMRNRFGWSSKDPETAQQSVFDGAALVDAMKSVAHDIQETSRDAREKRRAERSAEELRDVPADDMARR